MTHRSSSLDRAKLEYINKRHLMRTWSKPQRLEDLAKKVHEEIKEQFPSRYQSGIYLWLLLMGCFPVSILVLIISKMLFFSSKWAVVLSWIRSPSYIVRLVGAHHERPRCPASCTVVFHRTELKGFGSAGDVGTTSGVCAQWDIRLLEFTSIPHQDFQGIS